MNGPIKLECNITLGGEGLPGTNTLVYCTHCKSYEENEVYARHVDKGVCEAATNKRSSLLQKLDEKKFYSIGRCK